jgi:hypothetical protein
MPPTNSRAAITTGKFRASRVAKMVEVNGGRV